MWILKKNSTRYPFDENMTETFLSKLLSSLQLVAQRKWWHVASVVGQVSHQVLLFNMKFVPNIKNVHKKIYQ
jgi:hypothetical protein